jgi:hypothetical protein
VSGCDTPYECGPECPGPEKSGPGPCAPPAWFYLAFLVLALWTAWAFNRTLQRHRTVPAAERARAVRTYAAP